MLQFATFTVLPTSITFTNLFHNLHSVIEAQRKGIHIKAVENLATHIANKACSLGPTRVYLDDHLLEHFGCPVQGKVAQNINHHVGVNYLFHLFLVQIGIVELYAMCLKSSAQPLNSLLMYQIFKCCRKHCDFMKAKSVVPKLIFKNGLWRRVLKYLNR